MEKIDVSQDMALSVKSMDGESRSMLGAARRGIPGRSRVGR